MFRSPSDAGLPSLQLLLQDLPATLRQVARHLGIAESTLATYKRTGNAPRCVMLALFWETKWGRSAADTEAANFGALHYRLSTSRQHEIERLARVIEDLEHELAPDLGHRAANSPVFRALRG